jgi:NAD(P)-dependent dehydrogenase (short-subunit alcohol dehydrogenase family)
VIIADIQGGPLHALRDRLNVSHAQSKVLSIICDVTVEAQVNAAVEFAVSTSGRIDYAVNCAGITNKSKVGEFETAEVGSSLRVIHS